MISYIITGILGVAVFVAWIAYENHDKASRKAKGLPPRKYHDINDYDVETVFIHKIK